MEADPDTTAAIGALVELTYQAMSDRGGDVAGFFRHDDIAVAGSGQGELFYGPEQVRSVAQLIASRRMPWVPDRVTVWRRGEVAWAQILGHVEVEEDGRLEQVPYSTTGVFGQGPDGWQWLYWGGAEPQENPRV
jgi:hypothetical protein